MAHSSDSTRQSSHRS